jgi:hypothetical protein
MTCRDCGATAPPGAEDDDTDLMPGVCPTCFDKRVAPCFDPRRSPSLDKLIANLIAVGCHPERITKHAVALRGLHERRN